MCEFLKVAKKKIKSKNVKVKFHIFFLHPRYQFITKHRKTSIPCLLLLSKSDRQIIEHD